MYEVDKNGNKHYTYRPKYFDVDSILFDFDLYDEDPISLMKAQHIIAMMLGFKKWSDLINAPDTQLEYAKLRFENQNKISLGDWEEHIGSIKSEYGDLTPEDGIEFFKHSLSVVEQEGSYGGFFASYLLDKNVQRTYTSDELNHKAATIIPDVQIISLPLCQEDRVFLVDIANSVFEDVFERIEPNHPKETRELWDAGVYIDDFLNTEMLPISRSYASSQVEALLVHHIIGLAVQADKVTEAA